MKKMFMEVGVKIPVSTTNYIDDRDVTYSELSLHPKNKPSLFAEAGLKAGRFRVSAFYDTMRFKQSDTVYQYDSSLGAYIGYWQPRSESDMIGLRVGAAFY
jgi:hypothetical protein